MSFAGRGIVLRQVDRLFRDGTLAGLGDGQLLERYLTSGDETAFEALVDRHGPMVLGLCRRMLRDPRDIEDAFQATFLVLVRSAGAIRDRSFVSTWLYRVAHRVARQARNHAIRRRHGEIPVANLEASVSEDPEAADLRELGPVLDQELSRLPENYRAPLVLCYLKGRTHDQAAEELRWPVGTVRSRLARGRDLLRKRLTGRGYAPMAAIPGIGPSLPAGPLTEIVPPALASATVKAVLAFSSTRGIPAGAAGTSMLTLTQGVLTTMNLARWKWIGLALFATGLSAGGAVAISSAAARTSPAAPDPNVTAVGRADARESPDFQAPAARRILKGWGEVIDPDGDCTINLKDGRLTIGVPGRPHGLDAEVNVFNAPRVLREIEGDFIADLKLDGALKPAGPATSPNALPYLGTGLVLWSNEGDYIRLERAAILRGDQVVSYAHFEERRDRRRVPPGGGIGVPDGSATVLRLERKGDQVTAQVGPDGLQWRAFPPRTVRMPARVKLGVAAITSSAAPFTFRLEGFRVFRLEPKVTQTRKGLDGRDGSRSPFRLADFAMMW
jgi:RNA polymerase sigma factor (sigma-70 family)